MQKTHGFFVCRLFPPRFFRPFNHWIKTLNQKLRSAIPSLYNSEMRSFFCTILPNQKQQV